MNELNARQKWVVVLMDLMLLAEICLSVYMGQQNPAELTAVFLKTFVPAAALTVISARIAIRFLRAPEAEQSKEAAAGAGTSR